MQQNYATKAHQKKKKTHHTINAKILLSTIWRTINTTNNKNSGLARLIEVGAD
jgi:hypothetical protein